MRALKFSYFVGVFLVLAPPCFPHFVKAALGFRLGHSPTEQGFGQGRSFSPEKKGVGVQFLSGVNNGGWQPTGGLKNAASGYGLGLGNARSAQGSAYDSHSGAGSVRHLRILGLNLYLGGRAAHLGIGQPLVSFQPQATKKSILAHPPAYTGVLGTLGNLVRPLNALNLGANLGAGVKPHTINAPNGGKNVGAIAGIRGSVGSPNFGVGFNLGYRQGVNTKSPLGWALGLGSHGLNSLRLSSPFAPSLINKGQDQVILNNGGILRGHGHENQLVAHAPVVSLAPAASGLQASNIYLGFPQSLESPVASTLVESSSTQTGTITQPIASASTQQATKQPAPNQQKQKAQNQKAQQQQQPNVVAQQSVLQSHQQMQAPHQGRSYHGPLALGSTVRNNFLSFFRSRPSILRASPFQYSFNSPINPQALGSGPVRSVLNSPHGISAQRPQATDASQGWSTLYPVNGQQSSASNSFLNPVPANGQSLSRLQANLRPGTVTNVPLNLAQQQQQQLQFAQQQIPYLQQAQQQRGYGNFLTQGLRGLLGFGRQPPLNYPQQYFPHQQLQRPLGAQGPAAAQVAGNLHQVQQQQQQQQQHHVQPQFNFFSQPLHNPFQSLQNFQNAFVQNSPFFSNPLQQSSPVQATLGSTNNAKQVASFPVLPQFPFPADSPAFQTDPKFRYSHSTHSKPVNIASYTVNMDVTNGNRDASGAASAAPLYGPAGRRLKKAKKTRGDIIMKKQDQASSLPKIIRQLPLDMETAASNNQITLTSSIGATSWTPMVVVDPPKLTRKSLETPVAASVQVIKKPEQPLQIKSAPSPPAAPGSPERTMILRKRRLNEEVAPTVVPPSSTSAPTTVEPSTSTSSPSSPVPSSSAAPIVPSTEASA